jgi:hypothetical protein
MSIIEFSIHVENPEQISALFDRIQVWRSDTESGVYADITSDDPTSALIDGTVAGPWNLSGQSLTLSLDLAPSQIITFTGTNPLQLATVLAQINAAFPGLAKEVPTDTNKIRLQSANTGTSSAIQMAGAAAATLGLSTTKTNGKAARLLISSNTEDYTFRDYDGLESLWYKTRFYSSTSGAVSDYSASRMGGPGAGLGSQFLVTGKVALATATGDPVVGRRVIFVPVGPQVISDGDGNNYGVLPSVDRITAYTDSNGRASVSLVKGQRLKVFLEGTTFQREFIVPSTDFDILTVASAEPDPLSIVSAPPMPIRVS